MLARLSIILSVCMAVSIGGAFAQTFKVGQKVSFEDKWNRYGGGMISAVVLRDYGNGRYYVRIDKPCDPAFQENSFNADELVAIGAAPGNAADATGADAKARGAAGNGGGVQKPAAQPAAQQPAGGKPHQAHDWGNPAPPPRGSFRYGKPNLQPMLGHKAKVPPGSEEYFVGTPPGDESPVGRWYTRTGGTWTAAPGNRGDQYDKLIWGNPEVSELINVMPDGTWEMNDHGKVTTGKWYDIGSNVIRLIKMDDDCDWTASVYDHMIQFKGYNGITKEGNRY